jgi:hypothetical protein
MGRSALGGERHVILIGMLHETLLTNSTTTENREKEAHFEAHKVSGEACFGSLN